MNEFTIREILKDIWVYKKSRNKIPVIIFIIAVVGPMIYGFITSKTELVLLSGILLLPGIVYLPFCGFLHIRDLKSGNKL